MMNRFFFFLIFLFYPFFIYSEPLQLSMQGSAVILINAKSGAILFEKNSHVLHYPASTTKVATALYALKLKEEELDSFFIAQKEALLVKSHDMKKKLNYQCLPYYLEPDGTHIQIKLGEALKLRDLLKGLLIASGNDAANVIAQSIGPTITQFMKDLNQYLYSLGCMQTTFCNPHGLHHPSHQTTAYDLACLTQEALKYASFRQIVSQTSYCRPETNKQKKMTFSQSNRLLKPGKFYYPQAIGVKTGYHAKAKHTLIAAAELKDRTLIAVLLGYQLREQMFAEATALFEAAFNQPKIHRQFIKAGIQPFVQNFSFTSQPLKTYLAEPLVFDYYLAEDPLVKCFLKWDTLNFPVAKDQRVGELQLISAKGETLKTASLLALEEIKLKKISSQSATSFYFWPILIGLAAAALFLVTLRKL